MKQPVALNEIEKVVVDHAGKIEATIEDLPTFGYSRDSAYPHIEVDNYGYYFVVVERGKELDRRITVNLTTCFTGFLKTSPLAWHRGMNAIIVCRRRIPGSFCSKGRFTCCQK